MLWYISQNKVLLHFTKRIDFLAGRPVERRSRRRSIIIGVPGHCILTVVVIAVAVSLTEGCNSGVSKGSVPVSLTPSHKPGMYTFIQYSGASPLGSLWRVVAIKGLRHSRYIQENACTKG